MSSSHQEESLGGDSSWRLDTFEDSTWLHWKRILCLSHDKVAKHLHPLLGAALAGEDKIFQVDIYLGQGVH